MTEQQKSIRELVDAARKLEATAPTIRDLVLTEVRSAGYAVRKLTEESGTSSAVWRFQAPRGLGNGGMSMHGLLVARGGMVLYAEWNGTVYPQFAGWSQDENDAAIRGLLLAIRDDRR